MTETKHTPGPWKAECRRQIWFVSSESERVCTIEKWTRAVDEADAHLISAAPEMLAELQEAALQLEYLADKFGETGSGAAVLARVRAAIAKATGDQS